MTVEVKTQDETAASIEQTLTTFMPDGGVVEIRALGVAGRSNRTDSGYFDDFSEAGRCAATLTKISRGVYFTVNPCDQELLARAKNRIETFAQNTTANHDISHRTFLFIDADANRPKGISSTDEKLFRATSVTCEMVDDLTRNHGFTEPVVAMSGNGSHVHFSIDLPNDDESLKLVGDVLDVFDKIYSTDKVTIDQAVKNAARICRLYGMYARKGDSTESRPHRRSEIVSAPDELEVRRSKHYERTSTSIGT
jgi:hypothetical protein